MPFFSILYLYLEFFFFFFFGDTISFDIACLQQASQGKISKELVNRLMSIVGHMIQIRTLKVFSPPFSARG